MSNPGLTPKAVYLQHQEIISNTDLMNIIRNAAHGKWLECMTTADLAVAQSWTLAVLTVINKNGYELKKKES